MTALLPLTRTAATTWEMPVGLELCSALRTLWGGCGLGAAVLSMEEAADRPCTWAAVQYVRPIVPGSVLQLQVELGAHGRRVTQAQVVGRVDGTVALVGHASLGRAGDTDAVFVRMPEDVPAPQDCAVRPMPLPLDPAGTLVERFEQRWAQAPRPAHEDGVLGTGRTRVWMRLREPVETDRAALAVLADLAPSAVSEALGVVVGGVSLDNTVRYALEGNVEPGGWVLLDLRVEAVVADVAQLSARLFDPSGTLLATAGQSAVVRRAREPRGATAGTAG